MKIYTAWQIGEYHINHCEDYLFTGEIGTDKILCAVMDGCTMATDSYLIATITGKLLRKIAKERSYREFYEPKAPVSIDCYLKSIVQDLFRELSLVTNQLMLNKSERMTTLILLLIDKKENEGMIMAIGDGLVCINGERTEFDHDNKPDYIGFHLTEDFETWYHGHSQKIRFSPVEDISLATDGIFTFVPVGKAITDETTDPLDLLLADTTDSGKEDMLNLKLKRLEHRFGLKPSDDLAIIRIINT